MMLAVMSSIGVIVDHGIRYSGSGCRTSQPASYRYGQEGQAVRVYRAVMNDVE